MQLETEDTASAPETKAESKSFYSGWLDYIYDNTAHITNLIQFGEKEENYSLESDYQTSKKLFEAMSNRLNKSLSGKEDEELSGDGDEYQGDKRKWSRGSRVDTTLYDRLNLYPDASKSEIKASYRKLALKYHPDKSDDPEAKRKFQEIGEAYRVLIDDAAREKYDRNGLSAGSQYDECDVDPSVLFMMLFGCDLLEDYIGTVKFEMLMNYRTSTKPGSTQNMNISSYFSAASFTSQPTGSEALAVHSDTMSSYMNTAQAYREAKIAVLLRDRIDDFIEMGKIPDSFVEFMENACRETYVDMLVASVGWVYENCAETFISESTSFLGLGATISNLQSMGRNINNGYNMIKSTVSVFSTLYNKKQAGQLTPGSPSSYAGSAKPDEQMVEQVGAVLDCFLTFVVFDIESAVRQACFKVCRDTDASERTRLKRAHVMKRMGVMMQKISEKVRKEHGRAGVDVHEIFQQAYIRAKKRSERDDPDP